MKLLLLLLIVGTVNLIPCRENYYEFELEVLLPDLQAIEHYMIKNPAGNIQATIRWPNDISFEIRKGNEFLEISGIFFTRKEYIFAHTGFYDKLYFKDGSFYIKHAYGSSADTPKHFSSRFKVYFRKDSEKDPKPSVIRRAREAENMPKPDRYLYISYYDFNEIKDMIEPFYETNERYLKSLAWDESPSTFLATTLKPYPYLVEYNLLNRKLTGIDCSEIRAEKQSNLRVLIGLRGRCIPGTSLPICLGGRGEEDDSNRMEIKSGKVSRLKFFSPSDLLTTSSLLYTPEEIFGVRMASTGFLADLDSSGLRMLSSSDLCAGSGIPTEHKISAGELLGKVKNVEPRFSYRKRDIPPNCRPNKVDFQVMGHFLVKSTNLQGDGNLNPGCPLVIEYKTSGPNFSYGSGTAQKLCTDDSKLWVEGASGHIDGDITLTYH